MLYLKILLLLGVANGAPIIGWWLLKQKLGQPLDGGVRLFDGRPLFGASKTIRGLFLALGATPLVALLLGLPWSIGLQVAMFAMLGDLLSSFIKRRLGLAPSSMALGLDQVPECLFPLLVIQGRLGLGVQDIVVLVLGFFILELLLSRLLFKWHLRNRPY